MRHRTLFVLELGSILASNWEPVNFNHAQVFEFPATNTTYCLFLWLHVNGMRDSRLKHISRLIVDSIHSEASS